MEGQRSYESSEKIKEINKRLEVIKGQLDGLLMRAYAKAREKVKEKANTNEFGLKGYSGVLNLDCSKSEYGDIQCEHNIKISFYNLYKENDAIDCYSHSTPLEDKISYEIQCTHHSSDSSFEFSDPSLIEGIKYLVLNRLTTEDPDVLTYTLSNIDKRNVNITAVVSRSGNDELDVKVSYVPYKSRP